MSRAVSINVSMIIVAVLLIAVVKRNVKNSGIATTTMTTADVDGHESTRREWRNVNEALFEWQLAQDSTMFGISVG